jgi:Tfp pilus assembly protein PilF
MRNALLLFVALGLALPAAAVDRQPRSGRQDRQQRTEKSQRLLLPQAELFADALFAAPTEKPDPARVFALNEPMRAYLHDNVATGTRLKGPRQALFDSLYQVDKLKLDYDTAVTRDAAEAFTARSGNCLSLVILTAAMAKEMGIPVQYQSVFIEESWSRSQGITFYDGHVNISLRPTTATGRISNLGKSESGLMTIDFVAPEYLDGRRARVIGEQTIVAMFFNNRSAEALAAGRIDDAYWWAKASITHDPRYVAAYNTLAVVYRRHGDSARAAKVLGALLDREPENVVTLTNMVLVQRDLGHEAQADALAQRLKELQPYPPFYFFDQGVLAMKAGDFATARDLFAREVKRAGNYHEFQFWLALSYIRLGEMRQANHHLALALENSTTEAAHQLYSAKLAYLKKLERDSRASGRSRGGEN